MHFHSLPATHDPPWTNSCKHLPSSANAVSPARIGFVPLPELGSQSPSTAASASHVLEQFSLESDPCIPSFLSKKNPSTLTYDLQVDFATFSGTAVESCKRLFSHGFMSFMSLWDSSLHGVSGKQNLSPGSEDSIINGLSLGEGLLYSKQQRQCYNTNLLCSIGLSGREIRGVEKMDISHAEASLVSDKANDQDSSMDAPLLSTSEVPTEQGKSEKRVQKAILKNPAINTAKHLLAGAISAIVSRTFVAPLERLKLEYMVRGAQCNVLEIVRVIVVTEGVGGFWKGNTVNLLRTAPFKAVNFFCYDIYRKRLLEITGKEEATNFERLIAGAFAGISATLLCFPMDTIRTRLVAPGGENLGGVIGCFQYMLRNEGFLSLYKGLLPSVISMAPSGAVFYGVYDILKTSYLQSSVGQEDLRRRIQLERERRKSEGTVLGDLKEEAGNLGQLELGPIRTLVYGGIAGICAETVTYPFEVVRRQLQMQNATSKLGALAICRNLVQKGGVGALYSGLLPSSLQVLPSAALSYFVYECMKIALKVS